jgi:hypothetical protein
MRRQLLSERRSKNKRKFSKRSNPESSELRMRLVMRNFTWNSKLVTMRKRRWKKHALKRNKRLATNLKTRKR